MPTLGEVLVKALTPPQPPPKELLLRDPYTPLKSHDKLWTPAEADFSSSQVHLEELYTQGGDFENSLYARGRDLEKSLSSPQGFENSLRPLTLAEQAAQFGKAIQSIPETLSGISDAIQGMPKAAAEIGARFRALGITIGRGLDWLERHFPAGPLDPYGHPVPRWNVQLYLVARKAYQGDYKACAVFLNEIGADRNSADDVLSVERLLEPTFAPHRKDLRVRWEQEPPEEARRTLRRLLEGHKQRSGSEEAERKRGEHAYEIVRHEENRRIRTPPELADIEHHEDERILYERLGAALPERQLMFCWYRSQNMNYEEIAAEMGIGISTVKTHARLAKNNPKLREMLGQ